MDDTDREAMRVAIRGLYAAADLAPPPDHRIVFVSSPFVARFAGGFAAAVWHSRKTGRWPNGRAATRDATDAATNAAILDATNAATNAAILAATDAATRAATNAATRAATDAAILDVTRAATDAATDGLHEWYVVRGNPREVAAHFGPTSFLMGCAYESIRMSQGGNQWSGWVSYLSFFRYVAKLDIDYSKWEHYENSAIHGGYRIMHKEFCIVSDRPEVLLVDRQNRPHCDTGPFCRWRDGSALYSIHGVRVPAWIVERPHLITAGSIRSESNLEVRRIMIERLGPGKYLAACKAKVLDMDSLKTDNSAPRALMEDDRGEKYLVGMDGSTVRVYHMSVPRESKTCREAHNAICGFEEERIIAES